MPPPVGAKVAFWSSDAGIFAEYTLVRETDLVPVPKKVTYQTAAYSIGNPLTVVNMVENVKSLGHNYNFDG